MLIMEDKETQIAKMANDLAENLRLCAGVKLLDHQVEIIAYELLKKYQPKPHEDSVVLSRKEYEKNIRYCKSIEDLSEKLNNLNLDLGIENQKLKEALENKGKETAEKIYYKAEKKAHFKDGGYYDKDRYYLDMEDLKEILKQFGVDLKGEE